MFKFLTSEVVKEKHLFINAVEWVVMTLYLQVLPLFLLLLWIWRWHPAHKHMKNAEN